MTLPEEKQVLSPAWCAMRKELETALIMKPRPVGKELDENGEEKQIWVPKQTEDNVSTILSVMPELKDFYSYDRFTMRATKAYRRIQDTSAGYRGETLFITDEDITELTMHLQRYYKMPTIKPATVQKALENRLRDVSHDSLEEWLDGLEWDGVKRLDTWLETYAHAEPSDLMKLFARKFLIGMVARGFGPQDGEEGVKGDEILVFVGGQGTRKSTLAQAIGGRWAMEGLPDLRRGEEEASRRLVGKWTVEIAELKAVQHVNDETFKDFISRSVDDIRPLYKNHSVQYVRRCRLIGTTNNYVPVSDPTGSRRYMIVDVKDKCDVEGFKAVRDQLFAEAVAAYDAGEDWWLTEEEEEQVEAHNTLYRVEALWHDVFMRAVQAHWDANGPSQGLIQVADVMNDMKFDKFRSTTKGSDGFNIRNVSALLKSRGWRRVRTDTRRGWLPPN